MSIPMPAVQPSSTPVIRRPRKIKEIPGVNRPMTYEEYLASAEEIARYDILDGYKVYRTWGEKKLPNPTREHQRIQRQTARPLEDYATRTGRGQAIMAPCDVLISRRPLRTRQPDVLFISRERLAQNLPETDPSPLSPAPELIIEILSPSDTRSVLQAKLRDYGLVDVLEAWLISREAETVEVLRLSESGPESVALYGQGAGSHIHYLSRSHYCRR